MATHRDLYEKAGLPSPGLAWLRILTFLIPLAGIWVESWILPTDPGVSGIETFDPFFPTPLHRPLCIALCLVAGLATWLLRPSCEADESWLARLDRIAPLLGFGLGVTLYYSVFLVVLIPMFLMMTLYFGLGLLGLSPYLYFGGTWRLLGRIRFVSTAMGRDPRHGRGRIAIGFLLGLMVMSGADLRSRHWTGVLERAISRDPAVAAAEIPTVRKWYSENELLRYCYVPSANYGTLLSFTGIEWRRAFDRDAAEEFRRLYYRVTGVPFNAKPPPRIGRYDPSGRWEDSWIVNLGSDREVGGEQVDGRVHSLTLLESVMEGVVDARTASARLRWTMEFKNSSDAAREARMIVGLPPDAAASELILWVNGVPSKAAFGGRAETRKAYQQVAVVQRRDPALLSTIGPDRVLLQVFPVPAQGKARVAVEITAPLFLEKDGAMLRLPHLVQRNYEVGHLIHQLDLRAEGSAEVRALFPASPAEAVPEPSTPPGSVKVRVSDRLLADVTSGTIAVTGAVIPSAPALGSPPAGGGAERHEQEILAPSPGRAPDKLWLVIDGSTSVGRAGIEWGKILPALPADPAVEVLVATDATLRWSGKLKDPALAAWLGAIPFRGGCDPVSELGEALMAATRAGDAPVVWIHGVQPFLDERMDQIPVTWPAEDSPVIALAADTGHNILLSTWGDRAPFVTAPRLGSFASDFERAILGCGRLKSAESAPASTVTSITLSNPFSDRPRIFRTVTATPADAAGSDEVRRLGALATARSLMRAGKDTEAGKLAAAERLVTPVTGAVVLEKREDYEKNGLEPPGDDEKSGTVPEPELLLLMGLGYAILRRRRG